MKLPLHSFSGTVSVVAEPDGLRLSTTDPTLTWHRPESWPAQARATAQGRNASFDIALLLQDGFASIEDRDILVPYAYFAEVMEKEFRLPTLFTQPSPFLLHIDRAGDMGTPMFRYKYRFLLAGSSVPLQRAGYYLHRAS